MGKKMKKDVPATFEEFYALWEAKIRTTVRNRTKIAPHEVDDVMQIIFTACYEKDWLSQFDGSFAFSTFIYTYVHTEIQNYINKRDSPNTVRSSGVTRYTTFSSLPVEVNNLENFLDKVVCKDSFALNSFIEDNLDYQLFIEETHRYKIATVSGDVSCFKVILLRLSIYLGYEPGLIKVKDNDNDVINEYICDSLGISPLDLLKVDTCLKLLIEKGVDDALKYLRKGFLL